MSDTVYTSAKHEARVPAELPSAQATQAGSATDLISPKTLFRSEAVEHMTVRQYGTVILTRPFSHVALTLVFVALALLLMAFFAFFETTRKVAIQGTLVPTSGVIRVFSNQVGVIKETRVMEGQFVREGDILFIVSGERSNADPRSTETLISELLVQRRDSFRAEVKQATIQAKYRREAHIVIHKSEAAPSSARNIVSFQ